MNAEIPISERILDTALELAEECGWEALTLHRVAAVLELSLADIHACYTQKDDLVEAWFDRADRAVLQAGASASCAELPPRRRLHAVIMRWLDSLHPRRVVTRQMLGYKLEPGHVHLQVLGLMRISRTVQWFREAALLESTDLHRIVEEVCVSSIYLACFARWLFDDSEGSLATSRCLERALQQVRSLDG